MSREHPCVLIVDDEKENRAALERSLKDDNPNWTVLLADGDAAALRILRDRLASGQPVDVVLTDLVMETEQGGMNVLQEARRIDPLVMAILFTAKEKNLDRYKAFDCGAFDVVEKNIRGASAAREINLKTRAALKYREWSQRIAFLRRYFDPAVFEQIEKDPGTLGIRERTVSICFWDIRGFSRLCETLKAQPVLVADFLREYCECGAQAIFEHGGILDKFIGDGIMALFGVLGNVNDDRADAVRAVRAAVALRRRFEDLQKRWVERWQLYVPQKIDVGLGCGIHTGEALVGNVGTSVRDQFTALGPHVNFAARIQGRAAHAQILMSQTTAARVRDVVALDPAGEISDVKNIPGEFKLYQVR